MAVGSLDPVETLIDVAESVPQVSAGQLFEQISRPNDLFLLDVRNDDEYANWRIEARYTPETRHLFYGSFLEDEESCARQIPGQRQVVVVCAKGGASQYVAEILRENYRVPAVNLEGGMIAWGNFYASRPVIEVAGCQIYQIDRVARGCLSYILISHGQAAVIDPGRHIQHYRQLLARSQAHLSLILDTHAHADHISGGPALAASTRAPYYLHPYDGIHPFDMLPAKLDYCMLSDGQTFQLGDLSIQVIHVPGHTLGQVNYLVTAGDSSSYLFSGDNIFVQSFGRPDLGGQGESWAPLVYETIFETINARVPSDALVLPGHYAQPQEATERGLFAKRLSALWADNVDLSVRGRQDFIQHVLGHLPEMPSQYIQIKRVNAGLVQPGEDEASELELGKNVCALTTAY